MKYILESEFLKAYDELSALTEDKNSTRTIKLADEIFNITPVNIDDITMDMPDTVKQAYVDQLNKYIIDSGRLRDYFLNPILYQVHHINLHSLGGENSLENFIVLTVKEHQDIHLFLSEALEPYKDDYYATYSKCNKASKVVTKSEIDFDKFAEIFYSTAMAQSVEMARRNSNADISSAQSNIATGEYQINFTNGESKKVKGYQGVVDTCNERTDFPNISVTQIKDWVKGNKIGQMAKKYGIEEIIRLTDKQNRVAERPVILYPAKITDKIEIDQSKEIGVYDTLSKAAAFLGKYTTDLSACANKNKLWQQLNKQPFHWLSGQDGERYIIVDRT